MKHRPFIAATACVLFLGSSVLVFEGCSNSNDGSSGGPDASPDGTSLADQSAQETSNADVSTAGDAGAEGGGCVPPSSLDDAAVAAGFQEVWRVYRCQNCHQNRSQLVDDAGNGIVLSGNSGGLGDSGTLFPPNLTSDPATGLGCWTDQQIIDAILDGHDNEGGALCPSMPKYGGSLKTADGGVRPGTPMDAGTAHDIVEFLRSLPIVDNPVPNTTCADGG